MTPTQRLYNLLTRIGQVPKGLYRSDDPGSPWWQRLNNVSGPLSEGHALGLLCNAARRVCDGCEVWLSPSYVRDGEVMPDRYRVVHRRRTEEYTEELPYEYALIASLELIIEKNGIADA